MPSWLLAVILLDIAVTVAVVVWVLRRRAAAGAPDGTLALDFRGIARFSKHAHERIGDYVRANWSGVPDQLPGVLAALLDQLEADARAKSLALERDVLKAMLARSLQAHKIGRPADVKEALARVA